MPFMYLTFDCYGTLIDWRAGIEAGLAEALAGFRPRREGLLEAYVSAEKVEERTYRKYREVLRRSAVRMGRSMGVEVDGRAAGKFASSVPLWPPFSDTARFLREAGARGYRRYILSNVDTDLLERTISNNGLEVDGYVTAEEVGSYKPRRGHWVRFLEKTGATKDEVLHVAQSLFHDISAAQRLGIAAAWVNRYGEAMPRNLYPMFVTDTLDHLLPLLGSMGGRHNSARTRSSRRL